MYRNLFKIFRASLPLLVIPNTLKSYQAFFWEKKKAQNQIEGRVFIDVEVSNKPCEDRSSITQLKNVNGYAVAVFDGHGGWQMVYIFIIQSHLCSQILLNKLDDRLAANKQTITN